MNEERKNTPSISNSLDNSEWSRLYFSLQSSVNHHLYSSQISSWRGQERDLSEDVAQEAIVRTFLQIQKVQKGEATPILSLFHFSKKVATNHLHDIARKDFRLVRPSNDIAIQEKLIADGWVDPTESVLDDIENASLFTLIAQVIMDFPIKQRTALLIDLAKLSPGGTSSSPLQQALEKVGIRLDVYRALSPKTSVEKGRHAALLSTAYRRVRKVVRNRLQLDEDCSA